MSELFSIRVLVITGFIRLDDLISHNLLFLLDVGGFVDTDGVLPPESEET